MVATRHLQLFKNSHKTRNLQSMEWPTIRTEIAPCISRLFGANIKIACQTHATWSLWNNTNAPYHKNTSLPLDPILRKPNPHDLTRNMTETVFHNTYLNEMWKGQSKQDRRMERWWEKWWDTWIDDQWKQTNRLTGRWWSRQADRSVYRLTYRQTVRDR
jgi:hypothetical protein